MLLKYKWNMTRPQIVRKIIFIYITCYDTRDGKLTPGQMEHLNTLRTSDVDLRF